MQTFNLNYHKNTFLLISMVAVPLIIAGIALLILLNLPAGVPDSTFFAIIIIAFLFMIAVLRWLVNHVIIIPCQAIINHEGISFTLKKRSFLYKTNEFFSEWENVTGISEIFCSKTGINFHRITFRHPEITANFSAIKYKEPEADKFFNDLSYYQENYINSYTEDKKRISRNQVQF